MIMSFGSTLLIILRMLSFFNLQKNNALSVRNGNSEGKTLSFEIGENRKKKKEKKEIKISLLS